MPLREIPGPAGRLEALLELPPASRGVTPEGLLAAGADNGVRAAVVLGHPHPQFGGTMNNQIAYQLFYMFSKRGFAVLRFNFRGVGRSQGDFDHGSGELSDAAAALDWVQSVHPEARSCWVAGFSFGAWVGLQAGCQDPRIQAMVGLGVPVSFYDFEFLTGNFKPTLFVIGTRDEYCPRDKMDGLARRMSSSFTLRWVEGASHFFVPGLDQLQSYVTEFLSHIEFFRSGDA